jgi:ApaG protein
MTGKTPYAISVAVQTRFIDEQSAPADNRYVFAYTIRIANTGEMPAKLLTRHWIITDANGKVQEVRGDGVVGEQPYLKPGEDFHYTSGAVLETRSARCAAATRCLPTTAIASMRRLPNSPCRFLERSID